MTEYIQAFKFFVYTQTTVFETIHIEDWKGAKKSIIQKPRVKS